jgi:ribosome modulation factor
VELNRQACLDLVNEGKAAYRAGDPSDACPYDRIGNREQQFGYRYWSRGWVAARSEAESARP